MGLLVPECGQNHGKESKAYQTIQKPQGQFPCTLN